MIVLGLTFFMVGAGAAVAAGLLDQMLGVRHRNRCPACLCDLGACRGHVGANLDEPHDVLGLYCPLCRAQGAMITRQRRVAHR